MLLFMVFLKSFRNIYNYYITFITIKKFGFSPKVYFLFTIFICVCAKKEKPFTIFMNIIFALLAPSFPFCTCCVVLLQYILKVFYRKKKTVTPLVAAEKHVELSVYKLYQSKDKARYKLF